QVVGNTSYLPVGIRNVPDLAVPFRAWFAGDKDQTTAVPQPDDRTDRLPRSGHDWVFYAVRHSHCHQPGAGSAVTKVSEAKSNHFPVGRPGWAKGIWPTEKEFANAVGDKLPLSRAV